MSNLFNYVFLNILRQVYVTPLIPELAEATFVPVEMAGVVSALSDSLFSVLRKRYFFFFL